MPSRLLPKSRSSVAKSLAIVLKAAIVGAIAFAACSSQPEKESATATNPELTSTNPPPTAASTSTAAPVSTLGATSTTAPSGPGFAGDVMPILAENCASCHTASGPGAGELAMDTAGDVSDAALDINAAARVGYMPPWPASDGGVPFHDDRRLSVEARAVLQAWAAAGGGIDVDPSTSIVATAQTVTPLERDTVMVGQPYKGSTALRDDYRCQIYDPKITEPSFLQGYGLEADRTEVVHHALLFHAGASTLGAAERADAADPAVGWECGGLAGFAGDTGDVNQIMSWGPGQAPTSLPVDTGIAVAPGDFFVAQIHYHYEPESDDLQADESAIVIDLASDDVIAAAGGTLDPITLSLYLAPAEIPCSTDEVGALCDRAAMSAELVETWGPMAGRIADFLLFQCGAAAEDFAAMTEGIASSSCDLPAAPGQIVSLWGHMHEIGSSFRMTLNPGTSDELVLLDIPKWDFNWQLDYEPIDAIVLDADDVIRIECAWDRSLLDEGTEPRYIMWAEGTGDEMCYSQIVTRPAP